MTEPPPVNYLKLLLQDIKLLNHFILPTIQYESNSHKPIARTDEERAQWRIHRKLMHLGVGVQIVRRYREAQNNESKVIALDFLRDPTHYVKHLERYATSVVSIIAFGRRVASYNDPIITEVIAVMQLAAELNVPGKKFPMLLETFPCEST